MHKNSRVSWLYLRWCSTPEGSSKNIFFLYCVRVSRSRQMWCSSHRSAPPSCCSFCFSSSSFDWEHAGPRPPAAGAPWSAPRHQSSGSWFPEEGEANINIGVSTSIYLSIYIELAFIYWFPESAPGHNPCSILPSTFGLLKYWTPDPTEALSANLPPPPWCLYLMFYWLKWN